MKKKKKTKKTRSFYDFKIKIISLFISFYELRYLLINDIMRSISKWQRSTTYQKILKRRLNVEFNIQYLSRVFLHKQLFFRTTNKILRIRCSIMFFRIIEYVHFRRLFFRLHKEQKTIVKSLRRKNICSQEKICSQESTIKKKSAMKKKFAMKKDCLSFKIFRF
jgi:hypothetical protein